MYCKKSFFYPSRISCKILCSSFSSFQKVLVFDVGYRKQAWEMSDSDGYRRSSKKCKKSFELYFFWCTDSVICDVVHSVSLTALSLSVACFLTVWGVTTLRSYQLHSCQLLVIRKENREQTHTHNIERQIDKS
jgi:hypothetical protein